MRDNNSMEDKMDDITLHNTINALSRSLEDVTYRLYALEDSVANISAHIEEQKGEDNGESRRLQLERKD